MQHVKAFTPHTRPSRSFASLAVHRSQHVRLRTCTLHALPDVPVRAQQLSDGLHLSKGGFRRYDDFSLFCLRGVGAGQYQKWLNSPAYEQRRRAPTETPRVATLVRSREREVVRIQALARGVHGRRRLLWARQDAVRHLDWKKRNGFHTQFTRVWPKQQPGAGPRPVPSWPSCNNEQFGNKGRRRKDEGPPPICPICSVRNMQRVVRGFMSRVGITAAIKERHYTAAINAGMRRRKFGVAGLPVGPQRMAKEHHIRVFAETIERITHNIELCHKLLEEVGADTKLAYHPQTMERVSVVLSGFSYADHDALIDKLEEHIDGKNELVTDLQTDHLKWLLDNPLNQQAARVGQVGYHRWKAVYRRRKLAKRRAVSTTRRCNARQALALPALHRAQDRTALWWFAQRIAAVHLLQRNWRSKYDRLRVGRLYEDLSVLKIQRRYRGFAGRKLFKRKCRLRLIELNTLKGLKRMMIANMRRCFNGLYGFLERRRAKRRRWKRLTAHADTMFIFYNVRCIQRRVTRLFFPLRDRFALACRKDFHLRLEELMTRFEATAHVTATAPPLAVPTRNVNVSVFGLPGLLAAPPCGQQSTPESRESDHGNDDSSESSDGGDNSNTDGDVLPPAQFEVSASSKISAPTTGGRPPLAGGERRGGRRRRSSFVNSVAEKLRENDVFGTVEGWLELVRQVQVDAAAREHPSGDVYRLQERWWRGACDEPPLRPLPLEQWYAWTMKQGDRIIKASVRLSTCGSMAHLITAHWVFLFHASRHYKQHDAMLLRVEDITTRASEGQLILDYQDLLLHDTTLTGAPTPHHRVRGANAHRGRAAVAVAHAKTVFQGAPRVTTPALSIPQEEAAAQRRGLRTPDGRGGGSRGGSSRGGTSASSRGDDSGRGDSRGSARTSSQTAGYLESIEAVAGGAGSYGQASCTEERNPLPFIRLMRPGVDLCPCCLAMVVPDKDNPMDPRNKERLARGKRRRCSQCQTQQFKFHTLSSRSQALGRLTVPGGSSNSSASSASYASATMSSSASFTSSATIASASSASARRRRMKRANTASVLVSSAVGSRPLCTQRTTLRTIDTVDEPIELLLYHAALLTTAPPRRSVESVRRMWVFQ